MVIPIGRKGEREKHDWEPGDTTHPSQTDPLCRICGHPKNYHWHKLDEEKRCEGLFNPGVWPYAKRCKLMATVTTPEGSHYCKEHEGYDDE